MSRGGFVEGEFLTVATGKRRIGVFALVSAISQVFAMVAGLIVVRGLDVGEYALYSIAFSVSSATVILTGSGITPTLLSLGGVALASGEGVGPAASAARSIRVLFGATAVVPAVATVVFLFIANGSDAWTCVIAGLVILVLLASGLTTGVSRTVLQLHGRLRTMQWNMLAVAVFRCLVFAGALLVGDQGAWPFILGLGLVGAFEAALSQSASRPLQKFEGHPPRHFRTLYVLNYRKSIVGAIFLVMGAQVVSFVLTFQDNTAGIAQISALSRFAVLFLLVNTLTANIFTPRAARLPNERGPIRKTTVQLTAAYAVLSVGYVLATALFAPVLLWLLGPDYEQLGPELIIVAAGTAISNFAINGIGSISQSRGWLSYSWIYAPLFGVWFLAGYFFLDLTTSAGAVTFSSSLALVVLASQIVRFAAGYRSLPR